MAKLFIEESTLTSIADAIRSKEGSTELVPVTEMAERIEALGGGGYTEKNTVTFTGEVQGAVDETGYRIGVKIAHGLSQKPKYAIMTSDAAVDGTLKGGVLAGVFGEGIEGFSTSDGGTAQYGFLLAANASTGNANAAGVRYQYPLNDATGIWNWDAVTWICTKPANNQNFVAEITYTITFYA